MEGNGPPGPNGSYGPIENELLSSQYDSTHTLVNELNSEFIILLIFK